MFAWMGSKFLQKYHAIVILWCTCWRSAAWMHSHMIYKSYDYDGWLHTDYSAWDFLLQVYRLFNNLMGLAYLN